MELEKLVVSIQADIADLKKGMEDSKKSVKDASDKTQKETDKIKKSLSKVGSSVGKMLSAPVKKMGNAIKGTLNKVKGMFEQAFTFGVLSKAVGEFGNKVKNVLMQNESFRASIGKLQASIYTAITPLVDVLVPVLEKVVDLVTDIFTKVAQFTTTLTGKTIKATAKEAQELEKMGSTKKTASFDSITQLGNGNDVKSDYSDLENAETESLSFFQLLNQGIDGLFAGVQKGFDFLKKKIPDIQKFFGNVIGVVGDVTNKVTDLLSQIAHLDWASIGTEIGNQISNLINTIDWKAIAQTAVDLLVGAIDLVTGLVQGIDWAGVIQAIFDMLWTLIESSMDMQGKVQYLVGALLGAIVTMIPAIVTNLVNHVMEIIEKIKTDIKNKGVFGALLSWLKDLFITPLINLFNGFWQTIPEGMKNGFKSALNAVIGFINTIINGFASAINFVIGGLNKISFTVPDWIPGLGGKTFGINIPQMTPKTIPQLAQGGIIDRPTLSVIGEKGPEAVLPLSDQGWMHNLADTLAERLVGNNEKIVLNVDGKQLGWATINNINNITRQTGTMQLVMG